MDNVQLILLKEHPTKTDRNECRITTLRPASKSKFQMQSWVVVGEMESPKSAKQSLYGTKKNAQIS
jgi:precorrin-3B methylase